MKTRHWAPLMILMVVFPFIIPTGNANGATLLYLTIGGLLAYHNPLHRLEKHHGN